MQQIYRRTPMLKCDFNKVALQLYWNGTSAWVFSCKFAVCFQNTFFKEYLWVAASVHPRYSHPNRCKGGIPYYRALSTQQNFSCNGAFAKRCNYLEQWLLEIGYYEKMTRKNIPGNSFLKEKKTDTSEQKLSLTNLITGFSNVWNILQEFCLLLAHDKEPKKIFPEASW